MKNDELVIIISGWNNSQNYLFSLDNQNMCQVNWGGRIHLFYAEEDTLK